MVNGNYRLEEFVICVDKFCLCLSVFILQSGLGRPAGQCYNKDWRRGLNSHWTPEDSTDQEIRV